MRDKIMDEAKKTFRPEFLNRLDDIIVFRSLTKPDLIQILDLEISKVMQRLKAKNIVLQLDEKAKDFLVSKGYDPLYGARPMRRAVERSLEDPLAEEILRACSTRASRPRDGGERPSGVFAEGRRRRRALELILLGLLRFGVTRQAAILG